MYPLKKGRTAGQAHVGLPEGTYEEEHGRKGFYGKSAHLYHTHPPTTVKSARRLRDVRWEADESTSLRHRHFLTSRAATGGPSTSVIAKVKPKTKRPNLYRVLILNDDYTPMEFVVHVLEKFFQKDLEAATKIMLHVHHHGIGECGIFTYEIAETKVTQVMDFARKHQHPLQCVMEKK